MSVPRICCILSITSVAVGYAYGQVTPPDYGFQWSTVSHPGNRNTNIDEAPRLFPPWVDPPLPIGGVNHEYRITTTEVSVAQWFEFVQAYSPYYAGSPNDLHFTGPWISYSGGQYVMSPGTGNRPASMSWRYAARYVNWLQNDQRAQQDAFETGVYDTSTFSTNPDGTFNDQREHSPDARFWIPTLDEWTKAVYYDPNRYGADMDGYWLYPNGTNTPLISGYPEEGGETSAGLSPGAPNAHWLDIGSYPDVLTPWGLLDASGGVAEWCETPSSDFRVRAIKGTGQFDIDPDLFDRLDVLGGTPPYAGLGVGLRIASAIPGPPPVPALGLFLWACLLQRRRQ